MGDERIDWRRLDAVADVSGGVTLGRTVPDGASVELPYLRVANVQDGFIDTSNVKTVRVLAGEVERYQLRQGDLVLTEGGDFDKLGRGAVWDGRIEPCLHQNHVFRVRCRLGHILPEYLALYLASAEGRRYFLSIAKQTTNLATISSAQLRATPVPCPSLAVQRHIVEVLDSVTEAERVIKASIAKLRTVRHSVVSAEIPTRADESLAGSAGVPVRWVPVKDAGSVRMGKQLSPDSRAAGKQFPYLRVANVLDGRIDYADVKTMGFAESERDVYSLSPGDILLNEGQSLELVGRSAIYEHEAGEFCFQNTLVRFRSGDGLLPRYAQAVFKLWLTSGVFAQIAKKTTSIAHLGGERFGALRFPLVPLAEQQRIIDLIDTWDKRIESDAKSLAKLRVLKQGIAGDLLSAKCG
ncbi:restriction endonuclease subunit S [Streptomyces lydicus]|uniref:restriction endonuclease subunit S n=1 Tax=Streptomyces lydicus TaxID=47763 RepID=UPI0036C9D39C